VSLDSTLETLDETVARLNRCYGENSAPCILETVLANGGLGPKALVSSFGAESVVLLHMVAQIDPALPVLFADTGMLFAQTLAYQREVAESLGLRDVRLIRQNPAALLEEDSEGLLHLAEADRCCDLRKVRPLESALAEFGAWFTGRKRFQGGQRVALEVFEVDETRIKVNPLAFWSAAEIAQYIDAHALPRHPMIAKGYRSIGCAPCTTPVAPNEDTRAGRWRQQDKVECGIHIVKGQVVRGQLPKGREL